LTHSSKYSDPERAAETKWRKRYEAAIRKKGLCTVCKFRDKEAIFGRSFCAFGGESRQYEVCKNEARGPHFEADAEAVEQFKRAA
jgi:hypothetical protein